MPHKFAIGDNVESCSPTTGDPRTDVAGNVCINTYKLVEKLWAAFRPPFLFRFLLRRRPFAVERRLSLADARVSTTSTTANDA
jgi:hypothetical protein